MPKKEAAKPEVKKVFEKKKKSLTKGQLVERLHHIHSRSPVIVQGPGVFGPVLLTVKTVIVEMKETGKPDRVTLVCG